MPLHYLTWNFIRLFLSGEKKLLRKSEVIFIDNVPKLVSLPCEHLWELAKNDDDLKKYFDTMSTKYCGKNYLLNGKLTLKLVINTIRPNLVLDIIQQSNKHKKTADVENTMVRVNDDVWSFLERTNHVIPGRTEKGANYLKVGRKATPRKLAEKVRLDIDLKTGRITKY